MGVAISLSCDGLGLRVLWRVDTFATLDACRAAVTIVPGHTLGGNAPTIVLKHL